MNKALTLCLTLTVIMLFTACRQQERRYVIGVSQCSADVWREKQNAELRMASYFQEGVELRFAAAYDSDARQVQQIDSLLNTGIDLLVVVPNQVQTISPAIDRAYDSGIPVIVFERKTNSRKFTAFMSADNYAMGRQMGEYIAHQLGGRGRVLEVKGLEGSSPAIERHKGFSDALKRYPDMVLADTLHGDWTEASGYEAVRSYQGDLTSLDFVFGQNDRMAIGALRAFKEKVKEKGGTLPRFCGIDGLPGADGGIRLVRDSILCASYIYPTNGDKVLQLAIDILEGKPFEKEVLMKSALVTHDNADVLLMQSDEIMHQSAWLDQLHTKADAYLQQLDIQRVVTFMAFGIIALLLIAIVLFYRYHTGLLTLRRERVVNSLWTLPPDEVKAVQPAIEPPAAGEEPQEPPVQEPEADEDDNAEDAAVAVNRGGLFIARFKECVEARLADSDLSVEDLASDMNLSRVQLYRKVKAITGSTPVELLRTARLKRAYQLLLTTDKSISEIAYQVGFTAPSYFTKCFKDEYGRLPGDVRS